MAQMRREKRTVPVLIRAGTSPVVANILGRGEGCGWVESPRAEEDAYGEGNARGGTKLNFATGMKQVHECVRSPEAARKSA